MSLRRSLQEFFDRHEAAWEILMIALAVVYVAIGFLPDMMEFSGEGLSLLDDIDTVVTIFFALEFATRYGVAPSRRAYVKGHWLDLVAIIPVVRWLRVARIARLVRLLRLVRLVRVLNSLQRLGLDVGRFARLNGLQWMMAALAGVMLTASILLFFFENPVNDKVQNYWDALYASLITWTTPGYGDIVPLTTAGRVCGLVLITSGLLAWGLFIANLSAFLAVKGNQQTPPAIQDLQQKLARVEDLSKDELVCLRGAACALIDDKIEDFNDEE